MADQGPLVISVSINGERSKDDNPNVPKTPDEIVATALGCYAAGAAVVHAHAGAIGMEAGPAAERYLASWRRVRAAKPDALWYPTISGLGADNLDHLGIMDDEIGMHFGVVDCGSAPMARVGDDGTVTGAYYTASFDEIRNGFAWHRDRRLGVHVSVFEPHYLRIVLAYQALGQLPQGTIVNLYFGGSKVIGAHNATVPFGLPPTRAALDAYLGMMEGSGLPWTVSLWGEDLLDTELPRLAIERGGHVQIGLEPYVDPVRKPTNEEQVRRVVELSNAAGRELADAAATLVAWDCPRRDPAPAGRSVQADGGARVLEGADRD